MISMKLFVKTETVVISRLKKYKMRQPLKAKNFNGRTRNKLFSGSEFEVTQVLRTRKDLREKFVLQ